MPAPMLITWGLILMLMEFGTAQPAKFIGGQHLARNFQITSKELSLRDTIQFRMSMFEPCPIARLLPLGLFIAAQGSRHGLADCTVAAADAVDDSFLRTAMPHGYESASGQRRFPSLWGIIYPTITLPVYEKWSNKSRTKKMQTLFPSSGLFLQVDKGTF